MRLTTPLKIVAGFAAIASMSLSAHAQLSWGGIPPSAFDPAVAHPAPSVTMAPVNEIRLFAQDEARGKDGPMRFGDELSVDFDLNNAGEWTVLGNGDLVWRLRIASPNAYSLSLIFDEYDLVPGAELYAYNDDRSNVYGMYSSLNNRPNGQFAIQPLPGEALTLEYVHPGGVVDMSRLSVGTVVHDYRDVFQVLEQSTILKAAGSCNNDVNCAVGAPWQDQIHAVAAIFIGGGLCSGSMINNTSNDGTQYFITANHCGSINNAVFRFNYEKANCGSGAAPTNMTVQGSTLMKSSSAGDYRLARIIPQIPASYGIYFEGWDRSNVTPSSTVSIHHPQVGPKKISFDFNPPSKSGGDWRINTWDDGVTEPGSSGGPLFSSEGLFIGALFGGQATCSFPKNDYYPRFGNNFNALKPWLNPSGAAPQKLQGFDPNASPTNCGVAQYGLALGGVNIGTLSVPGSPKLGGSINFTSSNFNGNSNGLVIVSLLQQSVPAVGGTLLVDVQNSVAKLPFALTGGSGTASLAIPNSPGLAFMHIFAQTGVRDTSKVAGWALSNAVDVTICP